MIAAGPARGGPGTGTCEPDGPRPQDGIHVPPSTKRREIVIIGVDELVRRIVEKSSLDTAFRRRLLADPKTAIGRELGIANPDSITVVVHESDLRTVHLALPPDPNLTEEQLEAVSPGLCCRW